MPDRVPPAGVPGLVATDLDGTLLRPDGSLSAYSRGVLADLDAAGVPVVLVTARPLRWMDDLWPVVGRHGVAICSNGAVVWDVPAGQPRDVRGLDPGVGLALVDRIAAAVPGATFAVETLAGLVRDHGFVERDPVPDGSPVGDLASLWTDPGLKLLVRAEGADPARLRAAVRAAVGDAAVPTWSVPGLVEISAPGVTKASALEQVSGRLGVRAADVVAFGDMPNDLPMLAWAGTAYAVANAHPDVRAAAHHVVPGNDEDGVARTLARTLAGVRAP